MIFSYLQKHSNFIQKQKIEKSRETNVARKKTLNLELPGCKILSEQSSAMLMGW